jgi:hypothetical protein
VFEQAKRVNKNLMNEMLSMNMSSVMLIIIQSLFKEMRTSSFTRDLDTSLDYIQTRDNKKYEIGEN